MNRQAGKHDTAALRWPARRVSIVGFIALGTWNSLAVAVLDEKGNPLEGFEEESCRVVATDTLAKEDDGWIQWNKETELRRVQGKQIQLRFTLQNARLYSFRLADEKTMKLPVPRATTR